MFIYANEKPSVNNFQKLTTQLFQQQIIYKEHFRPIFLQH